MVHTFGFISFNDKTGAAEFRRIGSATFPFARFDDSALTQSSFEFPMQWETDSMELETTVRGVYNE